MSDFDFEGLDFDPSFAAETDQAGEMGENMAVPFARFYNRLKEEKVDPGTMQCLTLMYAKKIWDLD